MYTTIKNIVLALCIGSIVAITINMKVGPDYKNMTNGTKASRQQYESASLNSSIIPVFNHTALALGFFVFGALFMVKPIRTNA